MSYAGPSRIGAQATIDQTRRPLLHPVGPPRGHDRNTAFLAGVALGAVVGAGIALLFAPHSGRSTRRRIARTGRHVADRGHDAWDGLGREFRRLARMGRRRREDASDAVADAICD